MASNKLEITVGSATDLKDVNRFTTMDVYTVVQMEGGPFDSEQKQNTHVAKHCGPNPNWNHPMKFTVNNEALQQNGLKLKFKIKSDRIFGDRDIGEVEVPVKELFDEKAEQQFKDVSYRVQRPSGEARGTLYFNYKFVDKFAPLAKAEKPQVMGYPPVVPGCMAAGGSSVCPASPPHGEEGKVQSVNAYPSQPPGGYPAPPPPQYGYGYQGYPPPPLPPQQYGYQGYPPQGYGGYPPQQVVKLPKKSDGAEI